MKRIFYAVLAALLIGALPFVPSTFAGAPASTTTVITRGIQGPPGPAALATTLTASFTMPTVGSSNSALVASSSGTTATGYVTVAGCGTLYVTSVANGTTLVLQNNGATGNAAGGSVCGAVSGAVSTSGPQGPGGAQGDAGATGPPGSTGATGPSGTGDAGRDAFTTLTTSFPMPASGSTTTAAVVTSAPFIVGQPVYIGTAGSMTVTAIPDATHLTVQNVGATGNAGTGATIPSGAGVSPGGVPGASGPAGDAGTSGFTAGGDLSGTSTSQQVNGGNPPGTSAATAPNMTFTAPISSNANGTSGNVAFVTGAPTGSGAESYLTWSRKTSGTNVEDWAVGSYNAGLGDATIAMWMGLNGAAKSTNNPVLIQSAGTTYVGAASQVNINLSGGSYFKFSINGFITSYPILGDGIGSPWGVHGESIGNTITASRAVTPAEYAMQHINMSPNAAGYTLTFPAVSTAAFAYGKWYKSTNFSVTLSNGGAATVATTANQWHYYLFDSAGVTLLL